MSDTAKAFEVEGRMMKEGQALTFAIDETTKIMRDRKEIPFTELKKGMQVTIEYKKEGGKMIAVSIEEVVPQTAPKKGDPAEK